MGSSQSTRPVDIRSSVLKFVRKFDDSSDKKPSLDDCFIGNYENPLCQCGTVVCKMQSYCLDNRCLSVKLSNGVFSVFDRTYSKVFKFATKLTKSSLLPKKSFEDTGLKECNAVCFYKNLIIIQVFCQSCIKFVICDCVSNDIILEYDMRYIGPMKLRLFECSLSPDKSLLIIKTNHMYQTLCCNGYGLITLNIVKLDFRNKSCVELPCPDLQHANFGITFDRTSSDNSLLIVTLRDELPVITRHCVNTGLHDFDVLDLVSSQTCKFCFVNTQSTPHGNHVLIAVLGCHSALVNVPAIIRQYSVVLYYVSNDCLTVTGQISYVSPDSVFHYAPKLSASGRFICCGGKVYEVPCMKLKSLKSICCDVVSDMTLPEEIHHLPLPGSLKIYLENRL